MPKGHKCLRSDLSSVFPNFVATLLLDHFLHGFHKIIPPSIYHHQSIICLLAFPGSFFFSFPNQFYLISSIYYSSSHHSSSSSFLHSSPKMPFFIIFLIFLLFPAALLGARSESRRFLRQREIRPLRARPIYMGVPVDQRYRRPTDGRLVMLRRVTQGPGPGLYGQMPREDDGRRRPRVRPPAPEWMIKGRERERMMDERRRRRGSRWMDDGRRKLNRAWTKLWKRRRDEGGRGRGRSRMRKREGGRGKGIYRDEEISEEEEEEWRDESEGWEEDEWRRRNRTVRVREEEEKKKRKDDQWKREEEMRRRKDDRDRMKRRKTVGGRTRTLRGRVIPLRAPDGMDYVYSVFASADGRMWLDEDGWIEGEGLVMKPRWTRKERGEFRASWEEKRKKTDEDETEDEGDEDDRMHVLIHRRRIGAENGKGRWAQFRVRGMNQPRDEEPDRRVYLFDFDAGTVAELRSQRNILNTLRTRIDTRTIMKEAGRRRRRGGRGRRDHEEEEMTDDDADGDDEDDGRRRRRAGSVWRRRREEEVVEDDDGWTGDDDESETDTDDDRKRTNGGWRIRERSTDPGKGRRRKSKNGRRQKV